MRLGEIEQRVSSMEELERIVGAMRSIAAMRMQEAESALVSVKSYGAVLAQAARDALAIVSQEERSRVGWVAAGARADPTLPQPPGSRAVRRAVIVCMSEHGFVGGFNERLLEALEADLAAPDTLLYLGNRGAALAAERGHLAVWTGSMATRLASIPDGVRRLQEALYPLIARSAIARAEVIYGRYRRGGTAAIERRCLFPLELPSAGAPAPATLEGRAAKPHALLAPLHNLPAIELLERVTGEYILAQLTEAATESLAAENAARFAAMESAHDNVSRKREALRLEASRARQEEVTTELLDLICGEQALGG